MARAPFPLHSVGFCVHPAYQGYDQHTNQDVWKEFLDVMDKWCDGTTKKKILLQYTFYREKRGLFSTDTASSFSQDFDDPVSWWSNFGCEVPELQSFAMKALSQSSSASPCETNWSLYDWVIKKTNETALQLTSSETLFMLTQVCVLSTIHELRSSNFITICYTSDLFLFILVYLLFNSDNMVLSHCIHLKLKIMGKISKY